MSDFVAIKTYSNYVINHAGVVKNLKTGKVLSGGIGNGGYLQVRITNDLGVTLTWGLHRLLAWVFKANFGNITGLVINHIDGNKLNNDLDNLEIVTHQENMEHAGLNGLTEKCKPMSVRDTTTGEITKFASVIACARDYGLSKDVVSNRCHRGEGFVYGDNKQYKFGWDDFDTESKPYTHTGREIPVLVRNVFTGEVEEFNNCFLAAAYLKVSLSVISGLIRREDQPVTKGFVQIQPVRDFKGWIDHEDPIRNYEENNGVRCVYTWDSDGNKTLHYSARDAAKHLKIAANTLDYRLKSNRAMEFKDGTRCAYY